MMDFDKISDKAWNAAHDADIDAFEACVVLKDAAIAIKELQALLALAQEDAARYRWMRSEATGDATLWEAVTDYGGQYSMKCGAELDEAIDAAMRS